MTKKRTWMMVLVVAMLIVSMVAVLMACDKKDDPKPDPEPTVDPKEMVDVNGGEIMTRLIAGFETATENGNGLLDTAVSTKLTLKTTNGTEVHNFEVTAQLALNLTSKENNPVNKSKYTGLYVGVKDTDKDETVFEIAYQDQDTRNGTAPCKLYVNAGETKLAINVPGIYDTFTANGVWVNDDDLNKNFGGISGIGEIVGQLFSDPQMSNDMTRVTFGFSIGAILNQFAGVIGELGITDYTDALGLNIPSDLSKILPNISLTADITFEEGTDKADSYEDTAVDTVKLGVKVDKAAIVIDKTDKAMEGTDGLDKTFLSATWPNDVTLDLTAEFETGSLDNIAVNTIEDTTGYKTVNLINFDTEVSFTFDGYAGQDGVLGDMAQEIVIQDVGKIGINLPKGNYKVTAKADVNVLSLLNSISAMTKTVPVVDAEGNPVYNKKPANGKNFVEGEKWYTTNKDEANGDALTATVFDYKPLLDALPSILDNSEIDVRITCDGTEIFVFRITNGGKIYLSGSMLTLDVLGGMVKTPLNGIAISGILPAISGMLPAVATEQVWNEDQLNAVQPKPLTKEEEEALAEKNKADLMKQLEGAMPVLRALNIVLNPTSLVINYPTNKFWIKDGLDLVVNVEDAVIDANGISIKKVEIGNDGELVATEGKFNVSISNISIDKFVYGGAPSVAK